MAREREPVTTRFATDAETGRRLHFVAVPRASDLQREQLPPAPFVCLLAWNAEGHSVDELAQVATVLLDAGCAFLCCHGANCERVHDVTDEEMVVRDIDAGTRWPHVMTTWHTKDTLDETLHFFLRQTWIADGGDDYPPWPAPVQDAVVIEIGDVFASRRDAVLAALCDPAAFANAYREPE